jgi:hypothetical protein
MNNKIANIISSIFLAGCMACSYDRVTPDKLCEQTLPDTVSFSKHILPIFNTYCNTSGCHSGKNPKARLNLEPAAAYTSLQRKGSGYIDTLQPNGSVLYLALESTSQPMPPDGNLPGCDVKLILKWITQRAKNN